MTAPERRAGNDRLIDAPFWMVYGCGRCIRGFVVFRAAT